MAIKVLSTKGTVSEYLEVLDDNQKQSLMVIEIDSASNFRETNSEDTPEELKSEFGPIGSAICYPIDNIGSGALLIAISEVTRELNVAALRSSLLSTRTVCLDKNINTILLDTVGLFVADLETISATCKEVFNETEMNIVLCNRGWEDKYVKKEKDKDKKKKDKKDKSKKDKKKKKNK